jgi:hypothetical protein
MLHCILYMLQCEPCLSCVVLLDEVLEKRPGSSTKAHWTANTAATKPKGKIVSGIKSQERKA